VNDIVKRRMPMMPSSQRNMGELNNTSVRLSDPKMNLSQDISIKQDRYKTTYHKNNNNKLNDVYKNEKEEEIKCIIYKYNIII
jgi:hypothetical protein